MNEDKVLELIGKTFEKVNDLAVSVAELKGRLHQSPCRDLNKHLTEHDEMKSDWRKALISGAVKIVVALIIFAAGIAWSIKGSS